MSEKLSIEEIIRRAEEITAKNAAALKESERLVEKKAPEEEEEIKTFVPSKKTAPPEDADRPPERADSKTKSLKKSENEIEKTRAFSAADSAEEKTKIISVVAPEENEEDGELQSIPTIVVKDDALSSFNQENSSEEEEASGVQMTFEGFDEKVDTVEKIDEAEAEAELLRRREEKVGKFRLFGPDETDEELGENFDTEDDFDEFDEKDVFLKGLIEKKNASFIKLAATALLFLPMLLMAALKDSLHFPLFLSSHGVFFSVILVLYAGAIAINANIIKKSFTFKHSVSFDFPISAVSLIILLHTVLLLAHSSLWIDNGVVLAPVGTVALFMSQLAKYITYNRLVDNFSFITGAGDKYTVENITNAVDARIISRGMLEEENAKLKMSVKCDLPTNFMEISLKREPADKISLRIFIADAVLSLILFIVIGIIDNFNTGFNCALCALSISLPISTLYITSSLLSDISKQLKSYNSRVCGFEGAFMAQNADALVMEAADLFDKNSCKLHGIKTFNGASIDEALINTAAVMMQTKSPLSHVFDSVIIGKQKILPRVESVQYEEKMGTSGWIYKRKILVGTREMMQRHNIEVPLLSFEKKITVRDRKALYLSVDGALTAMFTVSYRANQRLMRELGKLEKSGITLIVKSQDPYINEETLTELFELPEGFIRVMNYSAARVYDKYSNLDVEKSPAYVVHSGSALGLVSAMRGAGILVGSTGLINFLSCFGAAIGFLVVAMLSAIHAYSELSAVNILIFEVIWTAFMQIVIKLRGTGL